MIEIEKYIEDRVKEYNLYQRTSTKNKKIISDWKTDEKQDLLIMTVESENPLPIPVRGIKYFTQLLIEHIEKEDRLLHDEILKKKTFFRTVDIEVQENNPLKNDIDVEEKIVEVKETTSLKKDVEETKEVQGVNINLREVRKLILREEIIGLLIKSNISEEKLEEIKGVLDSVN